MEKLPIELKEKWVTALRSGDYKQTTGTLEDDNGYCCLGVLCAITHAQSSSEEVITDVPFDIIPKSLQGDLLSNDLVCELVDMNDGDSDFNEIADYIEANL